MSEKPDTEEAKIRKRWAEGASLGGPLEKDKLSKAELENVFDKQVEKVLDEKTYRDGRFKMSIATYLFYSLRKKIPEELEVERHNVPLLLVLGNFLPIEEQLIGMQIEEKNKQEKRAGLRNVFGFHEFLPSLELGAPSLPYLLVNVEPGRKTEGVSKEKSLEIFSIVQRFGMNLQELVAFVTHFPQFRDNYVGSLETSIILKPGSLCREENSLFVREMQVPNIFSPRKQPPEKSINLVTSSHQNKQLLQEKQCWPSYESQILIS